MDLVEGGRVNVSVDRVFYAGLVSIAVIAVTVDMGWAVLISPWGLFCFFLGVSLWDPKEEDTEAGP